MDEIYIHNLLKKFIENNLTSKESDELAALFQNADADPVIHAFMDTVWDTLNPSVPFTQMRAEAVYNKILQDQRFIDSKRSAVPRSGIIPYWARIAATIILVTGIAFGLFRIFINPEPEYAEYTSPAGGRLKITLPDGSRVSLNSASHIRFVKQFTGNSREIQLEGEAYFDVTHNKEKPFIVRTGPLETRVLGTAFNISAYAKQPVEVTVARGKVSVNEEGKELGLLILNQQLEYNSANKVVDTRQVNAARYTAWTDGELILDNTSIEEASKIISRWYDVSFEFNNESIKNCRFVASFPPNAPLKQVLNVISKLNNFQYQLAGKNISISGNGCDPAITKPTKP